MFKKMAVIFILVGAVFLFLGSRAVSQNKEAEYFQQFQETIVLYNKGDLSKFESHSVEIAVKTSNSKLAAAAFYNAADSENSKNLKSIIVYLRKSLIKDPTIEKAKRNLEIAWRQVKENDLADDLGLEPIDGEGDGKEKGPGDNGQEKPVEKEETGGTKSTEEPLPYNEEEGFGRGNDYNDY